MTDQCMSFLSRNNKINNNGSVKDSKHTKKKTHNPFVSPYILRINRSQQT